MVERPVPVIQAERRAWDYWFVDGLPSLVAGVGALLISAVIFYSRQHPKPRGALAIGLLFTGLILYLAILLRLRQIIEWLKARITYPRTGYVASPYFAEDDTLPADLQALSLQAADARRSEEMERVHRDRKLRLWLLLALLGCAFAVTWLIQNPWICAAAGAGIAMALWVAARKDGRLSWIALAGFLFLGMYMSMFMFSIPRTSRSGYFLAGGGILFILDGGLALIRFLRRNPLPRA